MKTFARTGLIVWSFVAIAGLDCFAQQAATTTQYEQMLYDLGAFPVSKLTKRYFTNGNPGKVYSKGERIDVDGWLPPHYVSDGNYLTAAEKTSFGIPKKPLSYAQYMAMLDIDSYKRTHDPQLFLVMRFMLDDLRTKGIAVKKSDMLRVYEAQIGLEPFALPLLAGQLSTDDAMRLIRTYADDRLFEDGILPAVAPGDIAYITFLNEQANIAKWSIRARDDCFKLLFMLDDKTYRKPYRDFLLADVKTAKDWADRAVLYSGLIRLGDGQSLSAVQQGLVHDPVTECRESILYDLQQNGEVAGVIDAVLEIADGKDGPHHETTPSRGMNEWRYNVGEYLKWAETRKQIDDATLQKVREAVAALARLPRE